MGNADAMSRRGNKSDYYLTPWQCVQALLDKWPIPIDSKILDPCCGKNKVIGNVLRNNNFKDSDIEETDIIFGDNFLEREPNEEKDKTVIIANPSYSIKNNFIDKALEIASIMFFILPANVINYNEFQEKYLDNPHYIGRFLMRPKFFMEEEEKDIPKLGGVSSYAWFMWMNETRKIDFGMEGYIDLKPYFKGSK